MPAADRERVEGRRRRRRAASGAVGRDIGGSVATPQLRCQPSGRDSQPVIRAVDAASRLPPFRTSVLIAPESASMRTYAPADPSTVLDAPARRALARPRRRPPRGHPAARGGPRRHAGMAGRRASSPGLASRGHRPAVHPPGRGDRSHPRRRGRRRRHADGVGQDAVLRAARRCRRSPRTRRPGPCSSSRPRPSARTR